MTDASDRPGQGVGAGRRWDVALSFAGAQRDYVGQVAVALKARGVRCFYDADEQVRLWGTHLAEELPRIYAEETATVVVFISADYAAGEWTRLERRAALAQAVAEAGVYVLPARFDDSQLPGMLPDVVSVDLRRHTPQQFADLVAAKLDGLASSPPGGPLARTGPAAGRPLEEVTDPFALEVHRPVQPENLAPELPELPGYVPREHDADLDSMVRAASEGRSGIAVLVGGSSTGKTRACWEALHLLRDQDPPWRLWHPIDPTRPDAALRELPRIGPRTVVWLNEAQFYLEVADGGLGEQVAAGLRDLLRDPARAPVLVLATLWPQFWDTLTARPADGTDLHAQARELLAGHDITVPAAFRAAQLDRLARAGDVRLALAAAGARDGQVIQFLAGAPELLARYLNAPPGAAALINGAMDARRLGMGAGLSRAFLEAAAPGYLTDTEWDALGEDWLDQALAYTAVPCKGVRGPLIRIRPRPAWSRPAGTGSRDGDAQPPFGQADAADGPLYRLADYLDQHGRAHRKDQMPPAGFWAAADHTSPADQAALGDAAHDRGLYRDAAQLYKNAAAGGNLRAVSYLSNPPHYLRADVRPLRWAVTHAPLDDPDAVAALLQSLREAGAQEQIAALLDRDPAARVSLDDPRAVAALLDRLLEAGAQEQVTALADRAAARVPLNDPYAVTWLLNRLWRAGRRVQVTALAARVPLGDPRAVAELLRSLGLSRGSTDAPVLVIIALADRVPIDNTFAVAALLDGLRRARRRRQAAALLARDPAGHADLGDPRAVAALLDSLLEAGAHEQAAALLRREPAGHADLDDPRAVAALLDSLLEAGAQEQAAALLRRDPAAHVSLDNRWAVGLLLDSLLEAGAQEQAAALLDRLPLNNSRDVTWLLEGLRRVGAQEQALLDRAADRVPLLDDPYAVGPLLDRLLEAGAEQQAAALADRAAAHIPLDNPYAVDALLHRLRKAGAEQQVTTLADRAAAHVLLDNPRAVTALLDRLRRVGAPKQAAALADRAAAHALLDDPYDVAELLDGLRRTRRRRQAAALLRRDPAAHVSLDDLRAVAELLHSLRQAGAEQQVTALADRAAAHVPLDNRFVVARLLNNLREADAQEQVTALADRAAAHVPLDDPYDVVDLLDNLRWAGAHEQVTMLLRRDPAGHIPLDNPSAVAALLHSLRRAGAQEQAAALLRRDPAAHVPLNHPSAAAALLHSLQEAGAQQQITALSDRLPGAGMFELFREQQNRQDRFRFGREADGSPAMPWGWEDLN